VQVLCVPAGPKGAAAATAEGAAPGLAGGGLFVCTPALTAPSVLAAGPHGAGGWRAALAAAHHGAVPDAHAGEFGPVAPSLPWALHASAKKPATGNAAGLAAAAHPRGVSALAVAPPGTGGHAGPGQLAVSGSLDGTLALWALGGPDGRDPPQCVSVVQPHAAPVVSLVFAPSGTAVLSTALDRSVVVTALTGLVAAPLSGQGQETKYEAGAARNSQGSASQALNKLGIAANTKVLIDGFVKAALLRRANNREAQAAAARAQGEAIGCHSASPARCRPTRRCGWRSSKTRWTSTPSKTWTARSRRRAPP
jgi:hypothetical protein